MRPFKKAVRQWLELGETDRASLKHSCKLSRVVEHDSWLRLPRAKFQHLIQIMNEIMNLLLWVGLVLGPMMKAGPTELSWTESTCLTACHALQLGICLWLWGSDDTPETNPCSAKSCGLPQPGRTALWLKEDLPSSPKTSG